MVDRRAVPPPFAPIVRGTKPIPERIHEKTRILAEMAASLSSDPTSVRFLRTWVRTLRPGRSPLGESMPWMNFKAVRWIESYLRPTMDVFEYGAGGSTIFVARRSRRLVSIENDAMWYGAITRALRERGITNCEVRLIPPDRHVPADRAALETSPYVSTAKGVAGSDFESYVRGIDGVPDGSLDLVIVDGYARLPCIAHAVPKVRHGGYILVDDTDWPKYRRSFDLLRAFPRRDLVGITPFQRNLRQTSIWRIP